MASSSIPTADGGPLSVRDKLKAMRAASASAREQQQLASHTVPSSEPPNVTFAATNSRSSPKETQTVAVPAQALVETLPQQPMSDVPVIISGSGPSLDSVLEMGEWEYVIPLKMHSRLIEQYTQTLADATDDIASFLQAADAPLPEQVEKMEKLIHDLNAILKAPDLVTIPEEEDIEVPASASAAWAISSSSKFSFLNDFLENIRDLPVHVCLAVAPGRFAKIVTSFLDGSHFHYKSADPQTKSTQGQQSATGEVFVSVLPTGAEARSFVPPSSATVVIALDETFDAQEKQLRRTRSHAVNANVRCPVFHLIIPNSPEHISLCLPKSLSKVRRLQALVGLTWKLMRELGDASVFPMFGQEEPFADLAATFVREKGVNGWPLPSLEKVEDLEHFLGPIMPKIEFTSSSGSESDDSVGDATKAEATTSGSLKRQLEVDSDPDLSNKRQRSTPSRDNLTPIDPDSAMAVDDAPTSMAQPGTSGSSQALNKSKISMQELKHLRANLKQYEKTTSALQDRFEEMSRKYKQATKDLDIANANHAGTVQKLASASSTLQKAKDELSSTKQELVDAHAAASSSAVPGVSELAAAREEARNAVSARDKAEKRYASLKSDYEYVQNQYQVASAAAVEASTAVSTLEEEKEKLSRKASGNAVKLRELSLSQAQEDDKDRIQELEAVLADREDLLRRKDEEIKSLKNRGLATRGTSVPRSPKMYHSRPSSPAPGTLGPGIGASRGVGMVALGHPLRNS